MTAAAEDLHRHELEVAGVERCGNSAIVTTHECEGYPNGLVILVRKFVFAVVRRRLTKQSY